jgi:uncharacterized iron-regulated membrane protein
MKQQKTIRNWAFIIHRYLGLVVGIIIVVVGLTGSLLVFSPEIATAQIKNSLPKIIPQGERFPLEALYNRVEVYARNKDPNFTFIDQFAISEHRFFQPDEPTYFGYFDRQDNLHLIFVNPYTAEIIGNETNTYYSDRFWEWILELHGSLLAGKWGLYLVGLVGLLTTVLCLTGILLWPGWRKLINGFKIKWKGHIKRRNFDFHKVVGIIASIFLAMATLTGFCWNYSDWIMPAIYAVTFSKPSPTDKGVDLPVYSQPITGMEHSDLFGQNLSQMMRTAKIYFPEGLLSNAYIELAPKGIIDWVQCYPQQHSDCQVLEFDKYSGEVIRAWWTKKGVSLGDKIINSFPGIHYGFFGGLPTRIFYLFVGLSPTILLVTGSIMYLYRRRSITKTQIIKKLIER